MSKSIKIILVLILVAAIVITLQYKWNSIFHPKSNLDLKIGAVLPLSGDFASFGEEINRGAELAVDETQKSGLKISYFSQDDQSNAVGSSNAANKLIQTDKIDAALTATVQEVKPIAPVFNSAGTPLLAVWDSNNFIKTAGSQIFTIGFSTEGAGQKMANFAYNTLKIRKIALLPQIDDWSELINQAFKQKFTSLGGKVVFEEKTPANQKDFRTLLAKIKASGASGIYTPLLPSEGGLFLNQSAQLGIKMPIMMGDSFSSDDVAVAKQNAEGVYFSNLFADNTKALIEKYKIKFGQEPSQPLFVSFGYDGMKTLISAVGISKINKLPVNEILLKLKIPGTDSTIDFSGRQFSEKQERLYKVVNGEFQEVK